MNNLDSNRCKDCVKAGRNCTDPQCSLYRGEQQTNVNTYVAPQEYKTPICLVCNQTIVTFCQNKNCPHFNNLNIC